MSYLALATRTGRTAALAAMALVFPILLMAQNYVFGPNVRVNDDSPGSHGHMLRSPGRRNIAARGDTVYVAEYSDRANDGYFHVYFARSTNGGQSFGPSVRIDRNTDGESPSLMLDDSGSIHLCWVNGNSNGGYFIYYARSTDGGLTFTNPVRASDSTAPISGIGAGSLAVSRDGQRVYVAWDGGVQPRTDITLNRSTDGGRTFLQPGVKVDDDSIGDSRRPALALFNDTIILATWNGDYGIRFTRSTDAGASFGSSFLLNDTAGGNTDCLYPCIGVDAGGWAYVVYRDPASPLQLAVSEDTGRSFRHEQAIPGTAGEYPSLWASADGKLYVSYDISAGGNEYVWFIFSPDRGTTFLAPVNPSNAPDWAWGSSSTVVANDQGRVLVAWEDTRNDPTYFNDDIYFATGAMAAIVEPDLHGSAAVVCSVWPNPSRAPVHIEYFSLQPEVLSVEVYDLSGRLVRQVKNFYVNSGHQLLTWDGRDTKGIAVEPGIYFVRVQTSTGSLTRKVLLVKE